MTLVGWIELRGRDGEGLGTEKSKRDVYTVMFWNCMFKWVFKVVFVIISIITTLLLSFMFFRCFTITWLNGFRNTQRKWFMIFGKIFRKGVHTLTQRFSKSFSTRFKRKRMFQLLFLNRNWNIYFTRVFACMFKSIKKNLSENFAFK